MSSSKFTRSVRALPAIVAIVCLIALGSCVALNKGDENRSAVSETAAGIPKHEKLPSSPEIEPERDREWISDEEYMRRAAASPDQADLNTFFMPKTRDLTRAELNWQPLGPTPHKNEYWSGNADASGRVCALLVHPTDPNTVYAGGAQGGIWKTTDAGVNWTPVSDFLSSLATGALCFHPNNPDIIYYGTGEQHYSGDSFYGDGLFRSDDAGMTWTKIAAKSDVGSYISRVVVDPNNTQIIYLGNEDGLARSTDGGATWTTHWSPQDCNDIVLDPATPGLVYGAMRYTGIIKSTDYGANWTLLTGGLPTSGSGFKRINFAMAPSNPLVIYAAFADTSGNLFGMYKTTDGGTNWTKLTATPDYLTSQGNYDNCIIVDPNNANICYAGGTFPFSSGNGYGLVRTTDGGATWTDINVGTDGSQPHPDHHIFAWGSNNRLWLGNDGGVWYTDNQGATWTNCNANLALSQAYTVTIHPTDSNFLLVGTQDNGCARYQGNPGWPQVNAGDGGPCAVEWDSPNIYYTTYVQLNPIYKWNNGVWQGYATGPWSGERANWCNAPLTVDQNQADTLLAGTYRVWRTTNSGSSWSAISGDLTNGGHLRSITVATGASNTIYAGSSDGYVHVTTDASTWNLRNTGLPGKPIPDIAIDPSNWQSAYLCVDQSTGGRVYSTSNAGSTWSDITGDLPSGLRGMSMAADFRATPPQLYLGTDFGVYLSKNGGTNWTKEDLNLPNLAIYDLAVDTTNNFVLAGTHGRGVWRASADPTLVELVYFKAVGGLSEVALKWETATEIENAGFYLWRSRVKDGDYARITEQIIPGQGGSTWGAEYSHVDAEVQYGRTYYYYLEDVSFSGESTFHGPVPANVGIHATPPKLKKR